MSGSFSLMSWLTALPPAQPAARELKGAPGLSLPPLPPGKYLRGELLGQGAYSKVFRAVDVLKGEEVALKHLYSKKGQTGKVEFDVVQRVMAVHKKIVPGEQVITPVLDRCYSRRWQAYQLVFPLRGKSLHTIMKMRLCDGRGGLPLKAIALIGRQIATALHVTHTAGVIHADLAPKNVLVSDAHALKVEVADFGSAIVDPEKSEPVDYVTTRWYRAPEVLYAVAKPPTPALDVWSFGILLLTLYQGVSPFKEESAEKMMLALGRVLGPPPKEFYKEGGLATLLAIEIIKVEGERLPLASWVVRSKSTEKSNLDRLPVFFDLIDKILVYEPEKRILVREILAHPFFGVGK